MAMMNRPMKNHTQHLLCLAASLLALTACQREAPRSTSTVETEAKVTEEVVEEQGLARAYFASGCFWCVEAVYESVKGVDESISGYAGGHTENPDYDSSNTGKTGHAEAVEILYDPSVVSFATLVDVYFGSQNVTQVNGQGPDKGSQYRSILFYQNPDQKQIIEDKIAALERTLDGGKVAAEVMPFEKFWIGEDYHQNYERLHPKNGYIRNISIPRLKRFQAKFQHLLKESAH
ncbi:MAG: peptide-methionine (S)-S-oxide reductase [Planctomycetota bacterium]|jgi:peptide-methionine (S)-S-oxide reductase